MAHYADNSDSGAIFIPASQISCSEMDKQKEVYENILKSHLQLVNYHLDVTRFAQYTVILIPHSLRLLFPG